MNLEERRALFSHYGRFSTINPKVCLWLPSAGEFHTLLKQTQSFFSLKRNITTLSDFCLFLGITNTMICLLLVLVLVSLLYILYKESFVS